jgi:hypothetical protein
MRQSGKEIDVRNLVDLLDVYSQRDNNIHIHPDYERSKRVEICDIFVQFKMRHKVNFL